MATVGISLSTEQWNQIISAATINPPYPNGPATALNSSIGITISQTQAQSLMDNYYTNVSAPGVISDLKNYYDYTDADIAKIPATVMAGLQELKYNANKAIYDPVRGGSVIPGLVTALENEDWAKLAYSIAFNTASILPDRRRAEAVLMLGFAPQLDGYHHITSLTPIAVDIKTLVKYEQYVVNGSIPPYQDMQNMLNAYLLQQGYYVPQSSNDTWNSIAAQVKTNNGITISGYELKRINGMLPGSELITGKLVYVPTATSTVNTTPALISSIATTAQNPAYVYDGGTVYVVGSQLEDTQNNIKSNAGNIYVPESDGSVTVLHIPGISVSSNGYNNPVFTSPTDIFSFNGPLEVVQTGGVITQLDHIDYLGYQTTKTVVDTDATGADNNQVILTDNENGTVATQVVSATQADGLDTAELKFKGYTLAQSVYSGFTDTANRTYTLTDDTLTVTSGSDSLAIKNFRNGDFGVNVSQYDYVNDNSLKVKLVA